MITMNLLKFSTISELLLDNDPIILARNREKADSNTVCWVVGIFGILLAVAGVTLILLAGLGVIGQP